MLFNIFKLSYSLQTKYSPYSGLLYEYVVQISLCGTDNKPEKWGGVGERLVEPEMLHDL